MIVVGYHGRKGPKADPTVLGSAVHFLGMEAAAPIAVIKVRNTRSDKADGAFRWAVCFDGADCSFVGFEEVAKVMHKGKDIIEIVTVVKSDMNVDEIERRAKEFCRLAGIESRFNAIPYDPEKYIH